MPELRLYNDQVVETVFDLLGTNEDDITYSVGWGLANSDALCRALMSLAFGDDSDDSELTLVQLQHSQRGAGRTDIEVDSASRALVIEAKRGWSLPGKAQLLQYARRLASELSASERQGHLLVVSECRRDYPPVKRLPNTLEGIPVSYLPWSELAGLVETVARESRTTEKQRLRELHRYLRRLMTDQNTTSNLVYVAPLNADKLAWSSMTFYDYVARLGRYFHPIGHGFPKTPVNNIAFRFHGKLLSVHHVDDYVHVTDPRLVFPEVTYSPDLDWESRPHFVYTLGPDVKPNRDIRTGDMYARGPSWCALDLLLSSGTVAEATRRTRERHEAAGIPYPGV
jgi:hypothetical protein